MLVIKNSMALENNQSFVNQNFSPRNGSRNQNSSTDNGMTKDTSNPYYLHHSDNPGTMLVSQPSTSDNYSTWNRAINMALSVKNKTGFTNGSIKKPLTTNVLNYSQWIRCNNMVLSWIFKFLVQRPCGQSYLHRISS